jgi:hypothetical protein
MIRARVNAFLHQQGLDTTTPAGKMICGQALRSAAAGA